MHLMNQKNRTVSLHCCFTSALLTNTDFWQQHWKVKVKVTQSCLTLCDPMDYTVHWILQATILEWVSFPFSRGSSQPRDRTQVSRIAGGFFPSWATREAQEYCSYLHQKTVKPANRISWQIRTPPPNSGKSPQRNSPKQFEPTALPLNLLPIYSTN